MNKICTTIEQSQKLIKLGIDVNTADMIYYWFGNFELNDEWYELHLGTNRVDDKDILAWSLSALLELIQDDIKIEKTLFDQSDMFTYSIIGDAYQYRSHEHENLLDAAFEMVCWLLENEKI